ncbi:hypothetical protein JCM33374_g1350 [Metschnikowia sp. JCM 33374]|nr:hypothetical protein JCM33374_g1350 [Metschnikowia sp. JCM 33374]
MQFGHSFKKHHFPASNNQFVPVNHGSYGLPPQCVIDKYIEAFYGDLASPDSFLRVKQPVQYLEGIQAVAELLNCSYKNLALVTNATSGVNTILRSLPFQKGDKIALPSTTYGSCANTVKFLAESVGVIPVVVPLDYPMSDDDVVAKFEETFRQHKIKLALFDTVVSMPGVRVPFVEISQLCKEYGVLSLVDGAHSIGLLPIDLGSQDFLPDFYVSNLHKWLSLPRGCAVLYVDPKHHRVIQTMPISHSFVSSKAKLQENDVENLLVSKFTFVGSDTFASLACIPTAIKFRNEICGGEDSIRDYCEGLARKVGQLTLEKWPGTQLFENPENTLLTAMVTLSVPIKQYSQTFDPTNADQIKRLLNFVGAHMIQNYQTFVPFAPHNDKVVIRFSAQVYNEISDYEYAISAAQNTLKAFFSREANL